MSMADGRDETPEQRDDRNLMELLQELRVAGLGVQVLFGFLLSLPFTHGFAKLSHAQRTLFIADLLLAAIATVLLVGPVAYHRIVFRRHLKEPLIRIANGMAIAGLAAVGLAMSSAPCSRCCGSCCPLSAGCSPIQIPDSAFRDTVSRAANGPVRARAGRTMQQ